MATIRHWFAEMIDAAEHDDAATVARLALLVAEKVGQEMDWYAEGTTTPVASTAIVTAPHCKVTEGGERQNDHQRFAPRVHERTHWTPAQILSAELALRASR